MNRKTEQVDTYLQNLEPERRTALVELRSLVFQVVPDAVETMKYRMPTYQYEDDMLCAFASQKHYISLYMDVGIVEKHRTELQHLNVGKSCIRFKRIEQLPLETIQTMLSETVQRRKASLQ